MDRNWAFLIIPLLAVALYANTIGHGFVYDDVLLITGNKYTTQGFPGIPQIWGNDSFSGHFGHSGVVAGGRYRPLSVIMFAIEWQLAPASPLPGHLINVLTYALCALMAYLVLLALFPRQKPWYASLPFIAAVLFTIHPVHTEVVANIKSRDELLAMLFSLLSLWLVFRYTASYQRWVLVLAALSYLLALFSKENALNFFLIIPLSLWFFRRPSLRTYVYVLTALAIPIVLFIVKRYQVLGGLGFAPSADLLNNPFTGMAWDEKTATVLYTFLLYLKLMIVPWPLTSDYYPWHIAPMGFSDPSVWLAITILLISAILIWRTALKRKAIAWALLFFLISLLMVSNIFFPVGVFMAERFLFMPSLGFSVFIVWAFRQMLSAPPLSQTLKTSMVIMFVSLIFVSFTLMTLQRNRDWQDNFTLFTRDVAVSSESIKANAAAGTEWMKRAIGTKDKARRKALARKAIRYLRKAVAMYPRYQKSLTDLGTAHFFAGSPADSVLQYYHASLDLHRLDMQVYKNIARFIDHFPEMNAQRKIAILSAFNRRHGGVYQVNYKLGKLYGQSLRQMGKAILYLERAASLRPNSVEVLADLGTAYAIQGEKESAKRVWEKALRLSPGDKTIEANLKRLIQSR